MKTRRLRSRAGRRAALPITALVAVSGAIAALPAAAETGHVAKSSPRLFAPSSVWNRPLTRSTKLAHKSSARIVPLVNEVRKEILLGYGPWINSDHWSTPVYVVPARQRRVKLHLDANSPAIERALAKGVPIPKRARPAKGTDAHIAVYQPSSDTMWEFWQAAKRADGWHARWGGVMRKVSKSRGYYSSRAWRGLTGSEGWDWGATATSLPVAAGLITLRDLRRGKIDHALAISVPDTCEGVFYWPAQRTDGTLTNKDCLPAGSRLRLNPKFDFSTISSSPRLTQMLARAASKYGFIIRDKTGSVVTFYAEDPREPGVQLRGPGGLFGAEPWDIVRPFPWHELQLVRSRLCSKSPCRSPG
jgi:hypothetical protein